MACGSGNYCPNAATCVPTQCPCGYSCSATMTSPCPVGTYARLGDGTCMACGSGNYCPNAATCVPTQCPCGCSCDASTISPCLAGTYASLGDGQCRPCPPGYTCTSSEVCSPVPCTCGGYCPLGSVTYSQCPAGTSLSDTGRNSSLDCHSCVTGDYCPQGSCNPQSCHCQNYCPNPSQSNDCGVGMYSAERSTTVAECLSCGVGNYCPARSCSPTVCPIGTYCNSPTLAAPVGCPCGYYCPTIGTVVPVLCPVDHWCPAWFSYPIKCPRLFYCNETGMCRPSFTMSYKATATATLTVSSSLSGSGQISSSSSRSPTLSVSLSPTHSFDTLSDIRSVSSSSSTSLSLSTTFTHSESHSALITPSFGSTTLSNSANEQSSTVSLSPSNLTTITFSQSLSLSSTRLSASNNITTSSTVSFSNSSPFSASETVTPPPTPSMTTVSKVTHSASRTARSFSLKWKSVSDSAELNITRTADVSPSHSCITTRTISNAFTISRLSVPGSNSVTMATATTHESSTDSIQLMDPSVSPLSPLTVGVMRTATALAATSVATGGDSSSANAFFLICSMNCKADARRQLTAAADTMSWFKGMDSASSSLCALAVAGLLFGVHCFAVVVVSHWRQVAMWSDGFWLDVCADLRFPNLPLQFAVMLVPSSLFGALAGCILTGNYAAGVSSVVLCVALLGLLEYTRYAAVPSRVVLASYPETVLEKFALEEALCWGCEMRMLPRTYWEPPWMNKSYGTLFSRWRGIRYLPLGTAELMASLATCVLRVLAVNSRAVCLTTCAVVSILYFALGGAVIRLDPFRCRWVRFLASAQYVVFGVLVILQATDLSPVASQALQIVVAGLLSFSAGWTIFLLVREWKLNQAHLIANVGSLTEDCSNPVVDEVNEQPNTPPVTTADEEELINCQEESLTRSVFHDYLTETESDMATDLRTVSIAALRTARQDEDEDMEELEAVSLPSLLRQELEGMLSEHCKQL